MLKRRILTGIAATGLLSGLLIAFPTTASAYSCLGTNGFTTVNGVRVAVYTLQCSGGPNFRAYIWCKATVDGTTQKKYFGAWVKPTQGTSAAYCTLAYKLKASVGAETG
ncbi:hypothetical protein [Streptomyces sp. NPDC051677]|uniref:hypothetical protein n=1 Tax=Streptomyces sp. NPDC051677 TaxID=3365669 RepID=UPI0037D51C82